MNITELLSSSTSLKTPNQDMNIGINNKGIINNQFNEVLNGENKYLQVLVAED